MFNRRSFIKKAGIGAFGLMASSQISKGIPLGSTNAKFISTWSHGITANETALKMLQKSHSILDAVEYGVRIIESDPDGRSVGIGGLPDNSGNVTLDASIMRGNGACGAVGFLNNIEHPISVARKVMEDTPHVMLVGEGAKKFALQKGFPEKELLIPQTKKDYENWKIKEEMKPPDVNNENHDTIGLLGKDENGNMAGACTTSGWAYKMSGRLGDSPMIGSGLFVDDEVGAATASGLGEAIIQVAGCHVVVESMRQGMSPREACKEAVQRISRKYSKWSKSGLQACFIALRKDGAFGAYSLLKGFGYSVLDIKGSSYADADYLVK
jgi:N4-(beta-N-acetylglucosaminyl)-L-asparaginase